MILTAVLAEAGTRGRGKYLTLRLFFESLVLGDLLHGLMIVSGLSGAGVAMV